MIDAASVEAENSEPMTACEGGHEMAGINF